MKGGGGVSQLLTKADRGEGVYEPSFLADVICEQPLNELKETQLDSNTQRERTEKNGNDKVRAMRRVIKIFIKIFFSRPSLSLEKKRRPAVIESSHPSFQTRLERS